MDMDVEIIEVFERGRSKVKTKEDLLTLLNIDFDDESWKTILSDSKSASSKLPKLVFKLSELIAEAEWTEVIGDTFPYLLSAVLNQYLDSHIKSRNKVWVSKMIILISKLIGRYPSLLRFSTKLFQEIGSPMSIYAANNYGNAKLAKRSKLELNCTTEVEELLTSLFFIMKLLPTCVYSSWDIVPFLQYLAVDDEKLRQLSLHCVGQILKFPESVFMQLKKICKTHIAFDYSFTVELQAQFENIKSKCALISLKDQVFKTSTNDIIYLLAQSDALLFSVGGLIFESVLASRSITGLVSHPSLSISLLPTTVNIVREISLSTLSKFAPVCLYGPVGSGKTLLLQYCASIFGRAGYPQIISIQMSDQIDSKLLLGSYHSTDLPGQFVWKPGCLTKAVLNGYWIIFEDIDAASADVLTLLSGLIDNQKLSVPGFGEINSLHPDFRMFSTCRTQVGKRSDKIKASWRKLALSHVSAEELKLLIINLFPHFKLVADRLIELYNSLVEANSSTLNTGRIISLRDFLKFCRRVPTTIDFTQPQSAIFLFQEAFDLFVSSLKNQDKRQEIAEIIGTHLNLLKAKTEYFCSTYKPNLSICCNSNTITSGRYTVKMIQSVSNLHGEEQTVFSLTKRASCLLEMICGCIKFKEPVLLTGETGVGKTSCVQYLAKILHQKLIVVNLNRQSDAADLLGGYKPVELKYIFGPLREEFETLFNQTFNRDANSKFLSHIMTSYANRRWKDLLKLMAHVVKSAIPRAASKEENYSEELLRRWTELSNQLSRINSQMEQGEESPFAFSFIEGSLIKAIKNGHWILLDEINLATPEMLQCLYGIIDEHANIHLLEKGDDCPIIKHENFRLFAAMNPATDVGKKDLPLGLRNRFTEFYLPELTDPTELQVLVTDYLREMSLSSSQTENIVAFYLNVKQLSETSLVDGTGKKPHYSLRTLCRALKISSYALYGSLSRSLYESFCLSFLTQLDRSSHSIVESLVARYIFGKSDIKSVLNQNLPSPKLGKWIQVEGYWLPQGDNEPKQSEKYILTSSIRKNLKDLARIISAGKLPVLIQGETAVGKTSLIHYLAELTGNRCYRINNHQHTDLQEYVGSYQSNEKGKLVFTEGVLVQAMRKGEWIILDELNLAPSEVLEALNRVLDDNRQLHITETGQTINAHPRFMLFATQNPPGFYGGRKLLSRAFRNRFVELHFDEIPSVELEIILHLRCDIPQSYCKKIIGVLRELQVRRKASAALEGKHGFATLRDLFRWAERYRLSDKQNERFYDWDQHLADEGYLVLAGKVRKSTEAEVIREVLQKNLKRVIDPHNLFSLHEKTSTVTKSILEKVLQVDLPEFKHIVWTFQLRKLAVLIAKALQFEEPTLLVGETGCGKTTVVQLLSQLYGQKLYSINCHMNSEGSDFLGGLRPVRDHSDNSDRLFEWVNGPLIEAMTNGGIFLVDEISLADDSVLERLNSVLEPERTILMSEKGDETPTLIKADKNFYFVGTMNPGGDYGKKELSPALRNRLTEIWCECTSEEDDLKAIIEHNLSEHLKQIGISQTLISFTEWLKRNELSLRWTISIRDYLSWVQFINHACSNTPNIPLSHSIQHGACLVFLDGLGSFLNDADNSAIVQNKKVEALVKLAELTSVYPGEHNFLQSSFSVNNKTDSFGIGPFFIPKNLDTSTTTNSVNFTLEAPTTSQNGLRLFRAMQLHKPILLEGSPGVGKTALVSAIAKLSGFPLVRINLSEQTDISDLFGADLPVEGKDGGHFAWRDGPLLQALKTSSWILLDELNLASQSVLEGLNACLDHRGEIYVPELNRTFKVSHDENNFSRIIGCQNPVRQGGARKGLPKSFLNRFTQVYMDPLSVDDLKFILSALYPDLPKSFVEVMTHFANSVTKAVCQLNLFGMKGSPWDFNLRDIIRWCDLVLHEISNGKDSSPGLYVDLIYGQRMRTLKDSKRMLQLFYETKLTYSDSALENSPILKCGTSGFLLTNDLFICGHGSIPRQRKVISSEVSSDSTKQLIPLKRQLPALESVTVCLERGWMPILVGPSGVGKTCLIKLLSELCGHKLQIMTVSPEMDTMELLGGFEQADVYRKIDELSVGFCEMLLSLVQSIVCHKGHELDMIDSQILDLWSSLRSVQHLIPDAEFKGSTEETQIQERVDFLHSSYKKCKSLLVDKKEKNSQNPIASDTAILLEFENVEETLTKISMDLSMIYTHLKNGIHTGGFQWVDSILVKAITNGEWLLIDGANKCSASVLDRLNPLVEPNGTLFLSERGCIDGAIKEIKPHPEFRLILAMDPAYGEISRAMRNRGVEIFMPGPDDLYFKEDEDETNDIFVKMIGDGDESIGRILNKRKDEEILTSGGKALEGIKLMDLDSLLRAQGLDDSFLRRCLINLHEEIQDTIAVSLGTSERPTAVQLIESVESILLRVEHGMNFQDALKTSLICLYVNSNIHINEATLIKSQIENCVMKHVQRIKCKNPSPGLSLSVPNFISSQMYRVWKQLNILQSAIELPTFPLIEEFLSGEDKTTFTDLLMQSVYFNIISDDAIPLAKAIERKQPGYAALALDIANIINSTQTGNNYVPWDFQWYPHMLVKCQDTDAFHRQLFSIVRTSLLMNKLHFVKDEDSEWNPESLGTLAKSIAEGKFVELRNTDFFSTFFSLVKCFDQIFNSTLNNTQESKLPNQVYANLWQRGITTFLWYKRLLNLTNETWNPLNNKNERLMSNVTLLIQWIENHVVTFLEDMSNNTCGSQMSILIKKCLSTLNQQNTENGNLISSPNDVVLYKNICSTKPFFVMRQERANYIEEIMNLTFSLWSLPIKSDELLVPFFYSNEGSPCHFSLGLLCAKMFSEDNFVEDDLTALSNIKEKVKSFYDTTLNKMESAAAHQQQIEDTNDLKKSLFGLKEYIRICYSHKNSSFVSPLLVTHNVLNSPSFIKHYLEWEDIERFFATFVVDNNNINSNSNSIRSTNMNLLSVLVSTMILDKHNGHKSFRSCTLGSREVMRNCMEELNFILSQRMLDDDEKITNNMSLAVLKKNLIEILFKIKNVMGDHWEHENITQWLNVLESNDDDENDEDESKQSVLLGSVMIQLGIVLMHISSSLPIVDPAVEKEILTGYIKEEIAFFQNWITTQRVRNFLDNGTDILSLHKNQVHPFIRESALHVKLLKQKLLETEAGIAHRPNPPQYTSIRHDIKQFTKLYAFPEKMNQIICSVVDLQNNSSNLSQEHLSSVQSQCQVWIDAHKNFSSKLSKLYWYWDITAGYLFASTLVSKGLSLFSDAISHLELKLYSSPIQDMLMEYSKFPIPFQSSGPFNYSKSVGYQRSLKSELVTFLNEIETENYLSSFTVNKLRKLSQEIAKIWKKEQLAKEQQSELETSMYVYKGKERTMELSEEEQDVSELKRTFPTFDAEFNDFIDQSTNDKQPEVHDVAILPNSDPETLNQDIITVFLKVYKKAIEMVKNHWIVDRLSSQDCIQDFLTPFINRFEVACVELFNHRLFLGKSFGAKFTIASNLVVSKINSTSKQLEFYRPSNMYDFYHDSNVDEAQKLSPIFTGLRKRINVLLLDWPEHPSLVKILEVMNRIETFDSNVPLMKFLTGLELLLGTCQEWETCAHRGVSIAIHLEEITEMIINWRKQELHCWKNLLDITFIREQTEAHKWWFRLFDVIRDTKSNDSSEQILKALQQFIESSPLGQFETRLSFLYNIHCYIVLMKPSPSSKILIAYTWNVYNFYKQFSNIISNKITSLRSPIEKKLKDFVKISRWNDANFYALKDSVQKSQKTLIKLVKEWRKILQAPVSSHLIASTDDNSRKNIKAEFKPLKPSLYLTPNTWKSKTKLEHDVVKDLQIKRLGKLPKLYDKIQALTKTELSSISVFSEHITVLNDLNGTIIQTVHDLESLQAPSEEVPEKRKKILRNIHFRRRTALADLFKVLQQQLNLSYRRGLVSITTFRKQHNDDTLLYDFLIEPVDFTAGWKHLNYETPVANKELMTGWIGCEDYFQKCISRISLMQKSFESPSKELGPAIIDRCRGFVGDLGLVVIDQKIQIAKFSKLLWSLRLFTQQNLGKGIRQSIFKEIYHAICKIEYSTKQFIILTDSISTNFTESKSNWKEELSKVLQKCDHIKYLIKNYIDDIEIISNPVIQDADEILVECLENIEGIKDVFKSLESNSILGQSFREMRKEVEAISLKFVENDESNEVSDSTELNPEQVKRFEKLMNILLEKILLTFQNLNKLRSSQEQSTENTEDEEFSQDIKEKFHLELNCFEIEKVTGLVTSIFNIFTKHNSTTFRAAFLGLVPLLKQYSMMAQYYVTLLVNLHRASCKLLSTLSGVFCSLASKGFCLPADYENEAAEEGDEMDSKAGIGLGEGESTSDAKDVSDRIESEDQLEDTLKQGESVDPADKDLNDDENGIEMPDDFEGKQQDKEQSKKGEDESDSDQENDDKEDEMDKQMGDVDGEENNLDEQMWGGSSDEDDDDLNDTNNGKANDADKSEPELAAKDPKKQEQDSKTEEEKERKENKQQPQEINEMSDDEELNDDQTDPYHGQNEAEPEVEPMDLPEELNLDGTDPKDGDEVENDENPFDLDNQENEEMTNLPEPQKEGEPDENQVQDDEPVPDNDITIDISDDEDSKETDPSEAEKGKEDIIQDESMDVEENPEVDEVKEASDPKVGENEKDKPEPSQDTTASVDRATEPVPTPNETKQESFQTSAEDTSTKNDETASGLVESQDGSGHEGKSVKEKSQSLDNSTKKQDSTRKPGKSDDKRSLANDVEDNQQTTNRLKTLQDSKESNNENEAVNPEEDEKASDEEKTSDLFQHIRDADNSDAITIDDATKDQAEKNQKSIENEKLVDEEKNQVNDDDEEMETDTNEVEIINSETPEQVQGIPKEPKKSLESKKDSDESASKMEVEAEGEVVQTLGAQRPQSSVIETRFDLLEEWSKQKNIETLETEYQNLQVSQNTLTTEEQISALAQWRDLENKTIQLAQELCEQLRLILEPTQASRLKGDYKTGKRLNMRKVIPYIASGFRKDKIWLRRTQPSKREYQILLALDDSASMSDNQSKKMAFSAVAVVAKSLGLLEAGQLGVISFGEDVQLVHGFDEPFSDFSGARLLQRFTFAQRRTRIAQLLDSSSTLFTQSKQNLSGSSSNEVAQLLLIISDGRGVSNEGSAAVKKAVRKIRDQNIFVVFIIVDNPENKDSILDIRLPIFDKNTIVEIAKYMDHFPFPFYLILRDLNALPTVLSDALRQWFELVTSCER